MDSCPRCGSSRSGAKCNVCNYDESLDYILHPSLTPVSSALESRTVVHTEAPKPMKKPGIFIAAAAVLLLLLIIFMGKGQSSPPPAEAPSSESEAAPAENEYGSLIYDSNDIQIYRSDFYFYGRYHDVAQTYNIINNSNEKCWITLDAKSITVDLKGFGPASDYSSRMSDPQLTLLGGEHGVLQLVVPDAFVNDYATNMSGDDSFSLEAAISISNGNSVIATVHDKAVYYAD